MKNFGINLVGLPKYLTGSFENGILLLYNGPLYHEMLELMKKDNVLISVNNTNDSNLLELLPIYGTYKSSQRFFNKPSLENGADLGFSLLGDIGMITGIGALGKVIAVGNKARKAHKVADIAHKSAQTVRQNYWDIARKNGARIKHNEGVVNSLSIQPRTTKTDNIILERIKKNQVLKQDINTARTADDNAISAVKQAYQRSANLYNQAAQSTKHLLPSVTSTVGSLAVRAGLGTYKQNK